MNCEFIVSDDRFCKFKYKKEFQCKKYCTRHYNILYKKYESNKNVNDKNSDSDNFIYKSSSDESNGFYDDVSNNNINKLKKILKNLNIDYSYLNFISKYDTIYIYHIIIDTTKYSIKVQFLNKKIKNKLYHEYLLLLNDFNDSKYIIKLPKCNNKSNYYYQYRKFSILITELLYETLNEKKNRYCFSISEIKNIGIDLIRTISYIHSKKYLYIDLKPNNIMFTNEYNNEIKLIDFTSCSQYLDQYSNFYDNILLKNPIGNLLYSSININKSYSGLRIDDIESVLWILLYLMDDKIINKINNYDLDKIIKSKEKYIINYQLDDNLFIFNFINELKKYNVNTDKKPIYQNFIDVLK